MKNDYQQLREFLNANSTKRKYSKKVIDSLYELLDNESGRVYTGFCCIKPLKLGNNVIEEHIRENWTDEVASILDRYGINYVKGYDPEQAGANGAYIQITSNSKSKETKLVSES